MRSHVVSRATCAEVARKLGLGQRLVEHAASTQTAEEVERLFIALNKLVRANDEALTIGHSYFMSKEAEEAEEFSPELLNCIWKYNIIPLVKEYEYELRAGEVENKYGLESIRRQAGLR